MPLLTEAIPQQNFEIVRDQIGSLLLDELNGQAALNPDESDLFKAKIFTERIVSVDQTELPVIIVSFEASVDNSQSTTTQDSNHTYNVDFYVGAKSNENEGGDTLAKVKLARLMGVVRSIIHSPHYVRLGLAPPSISNRTIRSVQAPGPIDNEDSRNIMFGRIVLDVRFPETTEQFKSVPLVGNTTKIKLDETEKGYQYILENP